MRIARTIPASECRRAFTLVEMLVVILIIIVLVSLTAAGYFYFIGSQQGHNTEGNIRTIYKVVQGQWSWVAEQAKKETPSLAIKNLAGSDPTGERTRVLWIKARLMEAFPLAYGEVTDPNNPVFIFLYVNADGTSPAIPSGQRRYLSAYQKQLGSLTAANKPETESAACLLMSLSMSRGGSVLSPDQLGSSVVDTDGDGVKEMVDGFRNPLAFYRFAWSQSNPSGNPDIQILNPAPAGSKTAKFADPFDPTGQLWSWPAGTARAQFEKLFHTIADPGNSNNANYVIPVVVSAGPDMKLGLSLPTYQVASTGMNTNLASTDPNDNIYSFNLRGN